MSAVLPRDFSDINQPQVDLIHERSGLQQVAWLLPRHIAVRCPVQFLVNETGQLLKCLFVASAPGLQELSDLMRCGLRFDPPQSDWRALPIERNLTHRRDVFHPLDPLNPPNPLAL
jgi:hypothetical protein